MFVPVGGQWRRTLITAAATLVVSAPGMLGGAAAAQTVVLNTAGSQVTDTTIRNGSFANSNYDGEALLTRSSSDPNWERRTLLKFDTKNTIAENTQIASATLTLTVKSSVGGGSTPVQTFRITTPFQEADATWMTRQSTERWGLAGGDMAEAYGMANVPSAAGSKVSFDVTTLVQKAVNGDFDSRYTRIGLADVGNLEKNSYREYYSSEDTTVSRRPVLTVVLAGASSPGTGGSTSSGTSLKVMQWNIKQGSNIDGQVNVIKQVRPDVISFNEMMSYDLAEYLSKIKAATGQSSWAYKFEVIEGRGSIGVAVFSRLPIEAETATQLVYMRSAQDVRINVNGRTINFASTHLANESSAYRLAQTKELVVWEAGIQENRIVAGDFNWYPGTTEINEMGKTYYDSWAIAKSKGLATSAASNPDGNTRNNRIDYIWYSKGASNLSVVSSQVLEIGSVSDHRPVITTFKVN